MNRQFLSFFLLISFVFSVSAQKARTKEAQKIYEITDFCCEQTRGILDNFLTEIQNSPASKGFIIIYGGRNHSICEMNRLPKRAEINLIEDLVRKHIFSRKQNPSRFSLINGGYRENWTVELWIVSNGTKNPKPTPTLTEKEIKFRKEKAKSLNLQCEP